MSIVCNAIIENTSGKVLVCKKGDKYLLPSCIASDNKLLEESISERVLSGSITDIPDSEYTIFNVNNSLVEDNLVVFITFMGKTKKVKFTKDKTEEGYSFVSLSKLKSIIKNFGSFYDKEALRRYILRGTPLNEYE